MNKILSISIIVAVSFVLPASALAVPTFPPPACSLSAEPGRILVNFPGTKILSTSSTELGPIGAAVPAGTYKVTLMSWRSEEHTSELQSQFHLLYRLLL